MRDTENVGHHGQSVHLVALVTDESLPFYGVDTGGFSICEGVVIVILLSILIVTLRSLAFIIRRTSLKGILALCCALIVLLFQGVIMGICPIYIVDPLKSVLFHKPNELVCVDCNREGLMKFLPRVLSYLFAVCFAKMLGNQFVMQFIIRARRGLTTHFHNLYMDPLGRPYYVLNCLDKRMSNPESRVTNDLDLMLQYTAEFWLGGVIRPESGAFVNSVTYLTASWSAYQISGWISPAIVLVVILLFVFCTSCLGTRVQHALDRLQTSEAELRSCFARLRTFGESIAFYAGEVSEGTLLERAWTTVRSDWWSLAACRFGLDFLQLNLYFGCLFIAAAIAGPITWYSNNPRAGYPPAQPVQFLPLFMANLSALQAFMQIIKLSLDYFKSATYQARVQEMLEALEDFSRFALTSSFQVLEPTLASSVVFRGCSFYTPDGARLLFRSFNLDLKTGQSCLIMGPSGIGKSSLLRVLGGLWPLFLNPDEEISASFGKPEKRSLFFLAQKPYMFQGTLREQVAYPIWEDSLLMELTDDVMKRLFFQAHLGKVWEARQHLIDTVGICWAEVLSLGEMQRLQFCRLFWHAEWHAKNMSDKPFYAILDESTASLDVEAEMAVYRSCAGLGIGYLSVAHRPTVIQFHSQVISFSFDSNRVLQWEVRDGKETAQEAAAAVVAKAMESNTSGFKSSFAARASLLSSKHHTSGEEDAQEIGKTGSSFFCVGKRQSLLNSGAKKFELALVCSPYSPEAQMGLKKRPSSSFWRFCFMTLSGWTGLLLAIQIPLVLLAAVLEGIWAPIFAQLSKAVGTPRGTDPSGEWRLQLAEQNLLYWIGIVFAYGVVKAAIKAAANYFALRVMVRARDSLHAYASELYLNPLSKNYYGLEQISAAFTGADQCLSNDVDLALQFMSEFLLGGLLKVECGFFFNFISAITAATILWYYAGIFAPASAVLCCLIPLPLNFYFAMSVSQRQAQVQAAESLLRVAHNRVAFQSESICFYSGEQTERDILEAFAAPVYAAWQSFSLSRIILDLVSLFQYFSIHPLPTFIAAYFALGVGDDKPGQGPRLALFSLLLGGIVILVRNLQLTALGLLDLSKALGMQSRIMDFFAAAEAYDLVAKGGPSQADVQKKTICCCSSYPIVPLPSGELVQAKSSDIVRFSRCSIYTPSGVSLLIPSISLEIKHGESCLIMGPSGIGKSSLLRVLGGLWPLFQNPADTERSAKFERPEKQNLFFLAQRPFIFKGTLRQQISYPVWEESVSQGLTDAVVEELFVAASLQDVFAKRRHELDVDTIDWSDVLSLGEQQRLQFCRLFWHAEWHKRNRQGQPFYAILDESTASLDEDSEMQVYSECRSKGFGFLSVAHRPTVIQYHTNVLRFCHANGGKLEWENVASSGLAEEVASQIAGSEPVR